MEKKLYMLEKNIIKGTNQIWVKICGITNFEDALFTANAGADALGFILSTDSPRKISLEKAEEIITKINNLFSVTKFKNLLNENATTARGKNGIYSKNKTRSISFVAVLVNENFSFIKSILNKKIFDILQLSGDENLDLIYKIKKYNPEIKIIKALRIKNGYFDDLGNLVLGKLPGKPSCKHLCKHLFKLLGKPLCSPDGLINPAELAKLSYLNELSELADLVDFYLLDSYDEKKYGGTGKTLDWQKIKNTINIIKNTHLFSNKPLILAGGLNPENVCLAIKTVKPFGVDCSSGVESFKGKKDEKKVRKFIKEAKINYLSN